MEGKNTEAGMALLIAITIITIVIAGALELNRKVRSAVFSAGTTRDRVMLSNMTSSGVNAAMALLVKDKKESDVDSLQEDWANPEKIMEVIGDIPFEKGKLEVNIIDELGKIQVNALVKFPDSREFNEPQRLMWELFLGLIISRDDRFEDIEPLTIINSLKDWLDSGDDDLITGLNGAESDYYQDLDQPYACRNGPVPHLSDIAMIRGVTPELFHGANEMAGISDYLTVHGITNKGGNVFAYEGRININTAPLEVIAAMLPPEDDGLAQAIVEYRMEMSDNQYIHDLSAPAWYKNAPGCSEIEIDPELITVASDLYRIESTATLDGMKMTTTTVVRREKDSRSGKWKCRVLSWVAE
jgi:general secretion pathway protein K